MLNPTQKQLHAEMLSRAQRHRELEHEIIEGLRVVDQENLFRHLGLPSLFSYCVRALGFTESVSYSFIAVMRRSAVVPELAAALQSGEITVAKASRLTAALTTENAAELLEFARNHSTREVEEKIARDSGTAPRGRKIELAHETLELLRRAQDVLKDKDANAVVARALGELLVRHDPLEKAKRAAARNSERARPAQAEARNSDRSTDRATQARAEAATTRVENAEPPAPLKPPHDPGSGSDSGSGSGSEHSERHPPKSKRSRISSHVVHAVWLRDQAQCTFVDATGRRCENRRFLHLHHIKPVAAGGTNDVDNLVCLCSDHHALVHQLSFAIEGQVSWVRAPSRAYV